MATSKNAQPKAKVKVNAPSLREHDATTRARVLAEFAKCGRMNAACDRLKVARGCHYKWLQRFEEYRAEYERLVNGPVIDMLEEEAYRRAHEGVRRPVFQGGKKVGEVQEYSDSLLTFLLMGRRRSVYGNKVDVNATVTVNRSEILRKRFEQRVGQAK